MQGIEAGGAEADAFSWDTYSHGPFTLFESLHIMSGWKETVYSVVFKDVILITELSETSESAGGAQCQFQLLGSCLKQNKKKQSNNNKKSLLWIQQMQWIPCLERANIYTEARGIFINIKVTPVQLSSQMNYSVFSFNLIKCRCV